VYSHRSQTTIRSETIPPVCNAKRRVQVLPASSAPLQYTRPVRFELSDLSGSKLRVHRPVCACVLALSLYIAVQRPFNSLSLPSLVGDLCSERSSECVPFPPEGKNDRKPPRKIHCLNPDFLSESVAACGRWCQSTFKFIHAHTLIRRGYFARPLSLS